MDDRLLYKAGRVLGLAVVLAITAGCTHKPPSLPKGEGDGKGGAAPAVTVGTKPKETRLKTVAEAAGNAKLFLEDLTAGKAKTDQLSTAFRRKIAPPTQEAEKQAGYSQFQATKWLESNFGGSFSILEDQTVTLPDGISLRGRCKSASKTNAFAIRVVFEGDTYKVDWFHRSDLWCLNAPPQKDDTLLLAQDSCRNFVDLLLGGEPLQTALLMSPSYRAKLAPPVGSDPNGFDAGFLTQRLKSMRNGAVGYSIKSATLPAKDSALFVIEADIGGKPTAWTVRLTWVDGGGGWLVEEVQQ